MSDDNSMRCPVCDLVVENESPFINFKEMSEHLVVEHEEEIIKFQRYRGVFEAAGPLLLRKLMRERLSAQVKTGFVKLPPCTHCGALSDEPCKSTNGPHGARMILLYKRHGVA